MKKNQRVYCSWCGVTIAYGDASSHGICVVCAERLVGSSYVSSSRIDALPFGALGLDAEGIVHAYSRGDEVLTGRARDAVFGRSFFWDLAPSARACQAWGAFLSLCAREDHEPIAFDLTFDGGGTPARAKVTMFRARADRTTELADVVVWAFVERVTT